MSTSTTQRRLTRFGSIREALDAGWTLIRGPYRRHAGNPDRQPEHFAGYWLPGSDELVPEDAVDAGRRLEIRDISGPRSEGYLYGVFLSSQNWLGLNKSCHLRSSTIWFSEERNAIHGKGCFLEMFHRDDLAELAARFPHIPHTPHPPYPVTQDAVDWAVYRHSHWIHHECPKAERDALATLSVATVRRMMEIKRNAVDLTDAMIEQALAGHAARGGRAPEFPLAGED